MVEGFKKKKKELNKKKKKKRENVHGKQVGRKKLLLKTVQVLEPSDKGNQEKHFLLKLMLAGWDRIRPHGLGHSKQNMSDDSIVCCCGCKCWISLRTQK